MSEGSVEIKDLVKTYMDDRGRPTFTAVKNISLHVEDGEFMVLVGPSGCRKSTTLRMAAGLEKITSGTISIGELCALPAHDHLQQHGFRLAVGEEEKRLYLRHRQPNLKGARLGLHAGAQTTRALRRSASARCSRSGHPA